MTTEKREPARPSTADAIKRAVQALERIRTGPYPRHCIEEANAAMALLEARVPLKDDQELRGIMTSETMCAWDEIEAALEGIDRALFVLPGGGRPVVRFDGSIKPAPAPVVQGGDWVPGHDGQPPTATPIVPVSDPAKPPEPHG